MVLERNSLIKELLKGKQMNSNILLLIIHLPLKPLPKI